jgi:hypothetical protein
MRRALAVAVAALVGGCASFGRGVTEALLEQTGEQAEDTRLCDVEGRPFTGIEPFLRRQDALPPFGDAVGARPQVKIVYVHGIGTHAPGHSIGLQSNLAKALRLDTRAPRPKRILPTVPQLAGQTLGEINVSRLTDTKRQRDLVFYELTWSPITQPDKELIAFDKEQHYELRRAELNRLIRAFVNDIAADPLAYNGERREAILTSVGQTLCWAFSKSWSELPELTEGVACLPEMPWFGSRAAIDDVVLITHSLGSRATLDALQRIAGEPRLRDPRIAALTAEMRRRDLQVFMLSNQLPLLEAGQKAQQVVGRIGEYCGPDAALADQRFFATARLIAFSDPNDLMSYPVPDRFAETHIDSRLCPLVTNVTINVASVTSLLGLGDAANPLAAHTGYDADERIAGLIANGAGHASVAPIVAERCSWRETDESLMR